MLRLCTAGLPLPGGRPLRRGGEVLSHSSLLGSLSVSSDSMPCSETSGTDKLGLSMASACCSACPLPRDTVNGAAAPARLPRLRSFLLCGAAAAAAATAAASPGAMPGSWVVRSLRPTSLRERWAAIGRACLRCC